jgi:hypothetical protein
VIHENNVTYVHCGSTAQGRRSGMVDYEGFKRLVQLARNCEARRCQHAYSYSHKPRTVVAPF